MTRSKLVDPATFARSVVTLLAMATAGAAGAQVSADRASDYLGSWALEAEFEGNPVPMQLEVVEQNGVARAALKSALGPQPRLIDSITEEEGGLVFAFDTRLAGNSMRIQMKARLEGDSLVGTFGDEIGLFTAEFTGSRSSDVSGLVAEATRLAADAPAEPGRRRRFGSNLTVLDLGDGKSLEILYGALKLGTADHERFEATQPGEVFTYPSSRTIKLLTDVDLRFGDVVVEANNLAPNYPGVYAVWLERTDDGWNLLFNLQGDHWGTQYEPETDVARVPLEVSGSEASEEEILIEAVLEKPEQGADREESEKRGTLTLHWGPVVLSAGFEIVATG